MHVRSVSLRLVVMSTFLLFLMPRWMTVHAQGNPCGPSIDYATAAMSAYAAGDYEASLTTFFCATGLDPQNIDLQYHATIAMLRTGRIFSVFRYSAYLDTLAAERYSDMAAEAQAALEANLLDESAAVMLTFAHYPILQEDLDRLLAINPQSAIAYAYAASKAAYQEGDREAAQVAAERAVELASDDAEVLLYVSSIYAYGVGNPERALTLAEQALRLEPTSVSGIALRGGIYELTGDMQAALLDYNRAIALDPYDYTHRNRRGLVLEALADYSGALEDFRYVLSVNPGSPTALGGIVEAALILGDSDSRQVAAQSFQHSRADLVEGERLSMESTVKLAMTAGRMVRVPVFLIARQEVIISAIATDPASLDPLIMVVDPAGGAVAYNDDIDAEGSDYSAVVVFTPVESGEYIILAAHSGGGSEGEMTVLLAHSDKQ